MVPDPAMKNADPAQNAPHFRLPIFCALWLAVVAPVMPVGAQTLAVRERNCALQEAGIRAGRNRQVNACINLGWYLHLQNRDREAITVLTRATKLDPANEKAFNALGVIYLFTQEYPLAREANRQAIRLKADNEVAYYNLSLAEWELGQFTEAVQSADESVRLDPLNPHPRVALAIASASAGKPERAREAYREAIRLDRRYLNTRYLERLRASDFSPRQIEAARAVLKTLAAPKNSPG